MVLSYQNESTVHCLSEFARRSQVGFDLSAAPLVDTAWVDAKSVGQIDLGQSLIHGQMKQLIDQGIC
jgi:hypothetical protein